MSKKSDRMDKHHIRLQELTIADASLLSGVAIKAYSDHYLHLWFDKGDWYIDRSFSSPNLAKELADTNALFFLVYYNDAAEGFLKLNIDKAFEDYTKKEALELERIYLTKTASGKGVGTYLVQYVFEFAKQRNKKLVWLKVMDSSTGAINFYKARGFETCGTMRLDFLQMKEEFRGMIGMKKNL